MNRFKLFLLFFLVTLEATQAFEWEGHRGARGLYPENTIGAFKEALKYPVTVLETDVVVSKDKEVVMSHDLWMNDVFCKDPEGKRIRDKEHVLYHMNYSEIVKFDCGSLPYPDFPKQLKVSVGKPLLKTAIRATEDVLKKLHRSVRYSIEIKSSEEDEKKGLQPDYKTFTDLVMQEILRELKPNRFIIQSFDSRVLRYLHEKYPSIDVSALSEKGNSPQETLNSLGFTPSTFSPPFETLNPDLVAAYHIKGMKVVPWTVNEVEDMEKLVKMGVDGIITDYPDKISSVGVKECGAKSHLFEGKCVEVPAHAVPSSSNPGWVCSAGYVQKRSRCVKIKVPSHATLLEDGKTWKCNEGYERYRDSCKKSP